MDEMTFPKSLVNYQNGIRPRLENSFYSLVHPEPKRLPYPLKIESFSVKI